MFPEIDIDMEAEDIFEPNVVGTKIARTPLYDFDNKKYVVRDGKVVECNEDEAIRQWVAFLIQTKAEKYKVYDSTEFGTYIENYIGYKTNNCGYVVSEMQREIEEKCVLNNAIDYVDDFEFLCTNTGLSISLVVHKKDETEVKVDVETE